MQSKGYSGVRGSAHGIAAYRGDLPCFVSVLERGGNTEMDSVTVAHINQWLCSMQEKAGGTWKYKGNRPVRHGFSQE